MTDLNKVIFQSTNRMTDRQTRIRSTRMETCHTKKKSKLKIRSKLSTGISIETSKNSCVTIINSISGATAAKSYEGNYSED